MLTKDRRNELRSVTNTSRDFHRLARCLDECLNDLDEKDEQIIELQTTAEGEIQHTDVMDRAVARLKKELAAKDERIEALEAEQKGAAKGMVQMADMLLCDKCKEVLDGLASAAAVVRDSAQDGRGK